ncbi:methyl-accepting chemotaxis protein [Clostridium saccharoperbutylacetonicum]
MKKLLGKFNSPKNRSTIYNFGNLSKSLNGKLIITYIVISFIPILLISTLTYINNKKILTTKVSNLSNETSVQTKLNIDSYLSQIENATSLVFAHDNILVFNPNNKLLDKYQIEKTKTEIDDYLQSISLLQNFTDFALIYNDGTTIGKISETTNKLYDLHTIYSNLSHSVNVNNSKSCWLTGKDSNFNKLYYIKQVNDKSLMLVSIYTDELDEIFEKLDIESGARLTLVNDENNIIYSTKKDSIGSKINDNIANNIADSSSKIFESNNELITYNTCNNGWKLINSIPKNYILKETSTSAIYGIIVAIICMILSGLLGWFLANKISKPIRNIVTKMQTAADGDLTVRSEVIGKDEISLLSNNFNIMINQIRKLIQDTRDTSSIVTNESCQMKEMSNQTHEISESIANAMDSIANGAFEQSNELEKTLQAMDNLAQSINNIIIKISNVTNISSETKSVGNESLNIVNELKVKTHNTNEAIEEITSNIAVLAESIKEIEAVINLINDISEQTSLLSLNASIEAARAGETGKGFAVVADEIKKLSEKSKASTNSVYNVIRNVYSKSNSAISLIDNFKKVFKEQSDAVEFTNKSFINIISLTEKMTIEIINIENLMNEINLQKNETLTSTNHIKQITETSSANTEEVLAATEEQTANSDTLRQRSTRLSYTAKKLDESLNKFKV